MKIIKLPKAEFNKVRHLFEANYPNLAFVYAVIEDKMPGEIWVNDADGDNPKACLIISHGPYCFMAGKLDKELFKEFANLLAAKPDMKLVCPDSTRESNVELTDFNTIPRLQYHLKNTASIPHYENNTPYELKSAHEDREIFATCNWAAMLITMYGSLEYYLQNNMSLFLYDPERRCVASEAHCVTATGITEIGTKTHDEYQGKGLSTIICNELIRRMINRGFHPIWTCDAANVASRKVAEHQGMTEDMHYTFYTLRKP